MLNATLLQETEGRPTEEAGKRQKGKGRTTQTAEREAGGPTSSSVRVAKQQARTEQISITNINAYRPFRTRNPVSHLIVYLRRPLPLFKWTFGVTDAALIDVKTQDGRTVPRLYRRSHKSRVGGLSRLKPRLPAAHAITKFPSVGGDR